MRLDTGVPVRGWIQGSWYEAGYRGPGMRLDTEVPV